MNTEPTPAAILRAAEKHAARLADVAAIESDPDIIAQRLAEIVKADERTGQALIRQVDAETKK